MKKGFFCLIITLCLFGCQTKPTTEEILRTQTEQFLELTDTIPAMPQDLFDDAKTLDERTALAEDCPGLPFALIHSALNSLNCAFRRSRFAIASI